MPGQYDGRRFERRIDSLGGLDWLTAAVAEGRSLRSLAREIGCGRWWLDRWIYANPRRRLAVARARVAAFSQPTDAAS